MEAPLHPDAEDVLKTALAASLAVPVVTAVPNPRPDEFVRVLRTGGPRATRVSDRPQVSVECWSDTRSNSAALAAEVRQLVAELPGQVVDGVRFYRADELGGPVNLPDPESEQARFTFSVALHLRGDDTGS